MGNERRYKLLETVAVRQSEMNRTLEISLQSQVLDVVQLKEQALDMVKSLEWRKKHEQ